jgi:hypothetical protein
MFNFFVGPDSSSLSNAIVVYKNNQLFDLTQIYYFYGDSVVYVSSSSSSLSPSISRECGSSSLPCPSLYFALPHLRKEEFREILVSGEMKMKESVELESLTIRAERKGFSFFSLKESIEDMKEGEKIKGVIECKQHVSFVSLSFLLSSSFSCEGVPLFSSSSGSLSIFNSSFLLDPSSLSPSSSLSSSLFSIVGSDFSMENTNVSFLSLKGSCFDLPLQSMKNGNEISPHSFSLFHCFFSSLTPLSLSPPESPSPSFSASILSCSDENVALKIDWCQFSNCSSSSSSSDERGRMISVSSCLSFELSLCSIIGEIKEREEGEENEMKEEGCSWGGSMVELGGNVMINSSNFINCSEGALSSLSGEIKIVEGKFLNNNPFFFFLSFI